MISPRHHSGWYMLDLLFGGRHLVFESPLTLEEATGRLQNEIAVPEWRVYENRRQSFIGTFANGRFHMVRLVHGKNSFRPMIDGQLSPAMNGCRVDVRLKLPPVAVVACALFLVIGVSMILLALPQAVATHDLHFFALLGPLMLVMAVVVPIAEARKAERTLASLFQSEPSRFVAEGSRTISA
jgi:hypothetical protein